jgi:hypothetical protein
MPSCIQGKSASGQFINFLSPVIAGDIIIVWIQAEGPVDSAVITDTLNTTYTKITNNSSGTIQTALYYGLATASGANHIAVSEASTTSAFIAAAEFTGVFSTIDSSAINSSSISTTSTSSLVITGIGITGSTSIISNKPLALITQTAGSSDSVGLAYSFISSSSAVPISFDVNNNQFTTLTAIFEAQTPDSAYAAQLAAEIIESPTPNLRLNQLALDIISGSTPNPQFIPNEGLNLGQLTAEIIEYPISKARLNQIAIELVTVPEVAANAEIGQLAIEVVSGNTTVPISIPNLGSSIGQLSSEIIMSPIPKLNLNQIAFEVIDPQLKAGQSIPEINWNTPNPIMIYSHLTSQQLNASSSVDGQFIYNPPLNTKFYSAGDYTLSVLFLPTDSDLYSTATATVTLTVDNIPANIKYHAPIFNDAHFYENPSTANINIDTIYGDSLLYQFKTTDYEQNTVGYELLNSNTVPGNLSLNANTGWLTGNINISESEPFPPYNFNIRAYKTISESPSIANPYQTIMPVTLSITSPSARYIQWNTSNIFTNLIAGIPSTINVNASISNSFSTPLPTSASAIATMKINGANISDGGGNFSIGDSLSITDGTAVYPANIIVSQTANGVISAVNVLPISQQYTSLPSLSNIIWTNPNGHDAIINLDMGVDTISIINYGNYFDSATVGFSSAGETVPASATATIYNSKLKDITTSASGNNYQSIPEVLINGLSTITSSNPIKYTLTDGMLPDGLNLLSNGIIVGMPSAQCIGNNYSFTITAYVGVNTPNANSINFQTLSQSSKTFSIGISGGLTNTPQTNLSLEFLLSDEDYNTLFTPLNNQAIVPNSSIYRYDDFYFGKQTTARMLIAYGIYPTIPDNIIATISKYHNDKTYLFSKLQWAQSLSDNYEVIYIYPIDEYTDLLGKSYSGSIITKSTPVETLYPATLTNMITQINETLSAFDDTFLPRWMTDKQPSGKILGFTPAIPLLYIKPGYGKKILFYLQKYYDNNTPLNTIKGTTDRYIWNYGFIQNWNSNTNSFAGSDTFLNKDEGSIYLKFPKNSINPQGYVGI